MQSAGCRIVPLTRFPLCPAGVPGMVSGMLRHLHSLRTMRRDKGWWVLMLCMGCKACTVRLYILFICPSAMLDAWCCPPQDPTFAGGSRERAHVSAWVAQGAMLAWVHVHGGVRLALSCVEPKHV